jgi:proteasome lid subunit RPN8/RPN11
MPRHERPDKAAPAQAVADQIAAAPKKALWPAGLPISKPEKLSCFLPEDLKVVLAKEAFDQLFGYAYATHSEISCLGSVRREGNVFVVERFYLVKQDGSSAHTEMEPSAIAELVEQLLSQGKAEEARSIKCWAHSHPGMNVFWSKTDDDTCRLLASDYLVSLVVSDNFPIRARLDMAVPLRVTVDNVPVFCEVVADKVKIAEYEKEVAEKVKPANSFLFSDVARQACPTGAVSDDPWSDYFGTAYSLFGDEEETVDLDAVQEDPDSPL